MIPFTYEAGFVTLAELKTYLGISGTDKDTLLTALIFNVSQAIEGWCGRSLLRRHFATERYRGGRELIRVEAAPIAKIHSVRESETRDFSDSDNYEELVEGTDYVFENLNDGDAAGAAGVLRRLSGRWLGSERNPGRIQVKYTGGYKTPAEVSAEQGTTSIGQNANDEVLGFTIKTDRASESDFIQESESSGVVSIELDVTHERRAFLRFVSAGIILPSWNITGITLNYKYRMENVNTIFIAGLDQDLLIGDYETIWNSMTATASGLSPFQFGPGTAWATTNYPLYTDQTDDAQETALAESAYRDQLRNSLANGFIGFGFSILSTASIMGIQGPSATTLTDRPLVTVTHRAGFSDVFGVPFDLKHACLIQTSNDYRTRRSPGMRGESARGIAIASGASYLKDSTVLLPEVKSIVERYRRWA